MSAGTEQAILRAAAELLERGGPDALTTRAVCEAVGIKSPTLYHHFGAMDGLAIALVRQGLAEFLAKKRKAPATDDPLEQLREGWDQAIEFALRRPALHALYTRQLQFQPELASESYSLMRARVQRLVDRGVFKLGVEDASRAIWAAVNGVLSMIGRGVPRRDVEATSTLVFEALAWRLSLGER
jgi:AcrR family transcriptional regulator